MSVTDRDRERAAAVIYPLRNASGGVQIEAIAAALAEEREKARAPFLALADEYARDDSRISRSTMAIFRAVAQDLRRAAEES